MPIYREGVNMISEIRIGTSSVNTMTLTDESIAEQTEFAVPLCVWMLNGTSTRSRDVLSGGTIKRWIKKTWKDEQASIDIEMRELSCDPFVYVLDLRPIHMSLNIMAWPLVVSLTLYVVFVHFFTNIPFIMSERPFVRRRVFMIVRPVYCRNAFTATSWCPCCKQIVLSLMMFSWIVTGVRFFLISSHWTAALACFWSFCMMNFYK